MTYYVYRYAKGKRVLLSEHLSAEDAKAKAAKVRGSVVTDIFGKVVLPDG